MIQKLPPIKGIKWFRDIINDPHRQYGIEVLQHLPERKIEFPSFSSDTVFFSRAERKLINTLDEYYGAPINSRIYPDTYAASIENGIIIGNSGMVISPDGYLIAETASMASYADGRCIPIQALAKGIELEFTGKHSGNILSLANPNQGYAHHLIESLFPLIWFDDFSIDLIHTAKGHNEHRMNEFLTAFDLPVSCNISSTRNQYCSADAVSFLGPSSYFMLRDETLDVIEHTLFKPRKREMISGRKLYFEIGEKAPGAVHRSVTNDSELRKFLHSNGYVSIDPATLDINEKIKVISEAEEIITLGGSGGYNALFFASPSAKITFLCPGKDITSVYNNHMGNRVVCGYTDSPMLSIYQGFCSNKGNLLTLNAISACSTSLIVKHRELNLARFYLSPGSDNTKLTDSHVELNKFQEFYQELHDIQLS